MTDLAAQKHLNAALQSALIGAEQCRQLHASKKQYLAASETDGEADDEE